MKRCRGVKEVDSIKRDAIEKFCPVASSEKRRSSESVKIERWVDGFSRTMNSDAPYKTVDEAVDAIAPIAITLLGFVFRYAMRQLAIAVIKFVWARWHEPLSITVGADYE